MPFAISFVDDPGVLEKKKQARPIHIDYVMAMRTASSPVGDISPMTTISRTAA